MEEAREEACVLVVDDEPDVCHLVRRWLERAGYRVETYHRGEDCLSALSHLLPEAVCLDLEMPGIGGFETLKRLRTSQNHLPVIILTGDTTAESAVSAMKLGAYDYLTKPLDLTKLVTTVRNAVDRYRLTVRLTQLEREVGGEGYPGILGGSRAMRRVFREMDRVAATDVTVLIHGESGTGKELVARAIHGASGRRKGPFLPLNCAAIPESLQESELFGHEKGAFTGATARCLGKFELAHGGTLFLDEVSELSLPLQAKLLRVLQDRKFQRLGGSTETCSDFRLLAATHRDLAEEVAAARFREDLYFRVAVFELELPPLRERREDIPLLAQEFINRFTANHENARVRLSTEACERLMAYPWPGNVRELQNVLQRAVVVSGSEVIRSEDLPPRLLGTGAGLDKVQHWAQKGDNERAATEFRTLQEPSPTPEAPSAADGRGSRSGECGAILNLEQLERHAIEEAIAQTKGNMAGVARVLGIGRTTLFRKLKRYGLR